MGWHEPAVSGDWIPASAGMTGGGGAVSETGNHKGCPYDGLAGGYFLMNDNPGRYSFSLRNTFYFLFQLIDSEQLRLDRVS